MYYGLLVQTMPRLRLRPHGLIPGIAFGREPSNSTGGTFTRVVSGFPGALLNAAMKARYTSCKSMQKKLMHVKITSFEPHPLGEPPCAVSKAGEDRTVFPMCSLSHGPRN